MDKASGHLKKRWEIDSSELHKEHMEHEIIGLFLNSMLVGNLQYKSFHKTKDLAEEMEEDQVTLSQSQEIP